MWFRPSLKPQHFYICTDLPLSSQQPAAGPFWQPQVPKATSSSGPNCCTVLCRQAQLAGGLCSGPPVRKVYWFRSTGCGLCCLDFCTLPISVAARVVKLTERRSACLSGSTGAGGIATPGTHSSRLEFKKQADKPPHSHSSRDWLYISFGPGMSGAPSRLFSKPADKKKKSRSCFLLGWDKPPCSALEKSAWLWFKQKNPKCKSCQSFVTSRL